MTVSEKEMRRRARRIAIFHFRKEWRRVRSEHDRFGIEFWYRQLRVKVARDPSLNPSREAP